MRSPAFYKIIIALDFVINPKKQDGRQKKRKGERREQDRVKKENTERGRRNGAEEGKRRPQKTAKPLCDVFVSSSENDSISCLAGVC